jgi:hypothetical protein
MNTTSTLLAILLLAPSPNPPVKPETFWQTILRITGFTATPSTSKGPVPEAAGGDLWLATLEGGSRLRLTRDGGYQSPVFFPDGGRVLALREGKLVRVSTAGFLDPEPLFAIPEVIRLVGFDRESPGKAVVLTRGANGTLDLGLLDLADREVRSMRPETPDAEYRDVLARLARWDLAWQLSEPRKIIGLAVRPAARGSDVFCLREGGAPVEVSHCGGDRCDQPSLSADGRWVVFVRAAALSSRR